MGIKTAIDFFDLEVEDYKEVAEIGKSTTVYDEDSKIYTGVVPGYPSERYVKWGHDNQLPYRVAELIGRDEVTSQNKLMNVLTCYGAGVEFEEDAASGNDEIKRFKRRLPAYMINQVTDMKYYYFTVAVIILTKDGGKIAGIYHKDACHIRFQEADKLGVIRHVYYGNWKDKEPEEVERIELLDMLDPISDLMARMGKEPGEDGEKRRRTSEKKFAVCMMFPTVGSRYYPIPYFASLFLGGSYEEKRLVAVSKRARIKNSTSIKYQIEVSEGYYQRICDEENIVEEDEIKKRIVMEKESIKKFVTEAVNGGKALVSMYYVTPDGNEISDVRIKLIDQKKDGGDWEVETNVAANTLCYADGVHPNLVGAVPGKSQMNNSGSDKRELYTMKQAMEKPFQDMLLIPVNLTIEFNGWNIKPFFKVIQLTTLDEHKDLKETKV